MPYQSLPEHARTSSSGSLTPIVQPSSSDIHGPPRSALSPPLSHTSSGVQHRFSFHSPDSLPTADDPRRALDDPQIFPIFRHYIDYLASWYDLNERKRPFEDLVPRQALKNPLLMSSILAFGAIHLCRINSQPELRDVAEFYHMQCIKKLIPLVNDMTRFHDGDTLAATCLLRSYEILARKLSRFIPELLASISSIPPSPT